MEIHLALPHEILPIFNAPFMVQYLSQISLLPILLLVYLFHICGYSYCIIVYTI